MKLSDRPIFQSFFGTSRLIDIQMTKSKPAYGKIYRKATILPWVIKTATGWNL